MNAVPFEDARNRPRITSKTSDDLLIRALAKRRVEFGLSQMELAARLGKYQQDLGKWERGEIEPRYGDLKRWAKELNMKWDLIYGED